MAGCRSIWCQKNNPYASRAGNAGSGGSADFAKGAIFSAQNWFRAGEPVSSTCIRLDGTDNRRTSIVGPETCVFLRCRGRSRCRLKKRIRIVRYKNAFSSRGIVRDRFSGARGSIYIIAERIRTRCGIWGRWMNSTGGWGLRRTRQNLACVPSQ